MTKVNSPISNSKEISRRKFVGMTASTAAVFSILPSFTVSGLGHVAPSDKLYVAAIGCGGEGKYDIKTFMSPTNLGIDDHSALTSRFDLF